MMHGAAKINQATAVIPPAGISAHRLNRCSQSSANKKPCMMQGFLSCIEAEYDLAACTMSVLLTAADAAASIFDPKHSYIHNNTMPAETCLR